MQNLSATIGSQYANSPILTSIIQSFNDAVDPLANIDSFYKNMFNIDTAIGYGLDCWGRIVGVPRTITLGTVNGANVNGPFFGFQGGYYQSSPQTHAQPFGQGQFYSDIPVANNYTLLDNEYRQLILLKAYSNITRCTIPVLNRILSLMFPQLSNGSLTSVNSVPTGSSLLGASAYNHNGSFFYVTNFNANTISVYSVDSSSGVLTLAGTIAAGVNPLGLSYNPSTNYLTVANYGDNTIQTYPINPSTGLATSPGSVVAAGNNPYQLSYNPTGTSLTVANFESANIQTYSVSGGTLTSASTVSAGNNPSGVTYHPSGLYLAVSNYGDNTIQSYLVNPATGIPYSPVTIPVGQNPSGITYDPTGNYLTVANMQDSTVTTFTVNQLNGSLNLPATVNVGLNPLGLSYHPSGNYLSISDYGSNLIETYKSVNGILTIVGTVPTGNNPFTVNYNPNSKFLATANYGSNTADSFYANIGNVRVINTMNMTFQIATPIPLTSFQMALLAQTNVFNAPCGVSYTFIVA